MQRSFSNGRPIVYLDKQWVYEDTKLPLEPLKGRTCRHCGFKSSKDGIDPCLGKLPGVVAACCGHGVQEAAYVKFANGVILRGFEVVS